MATPKAVSLVLRGGMRPSGLRTYAEELAKRTDHARLVGIHKHELRIGPIRAGGFLSLDVGLMRPLRGLVHSISQDFVHARSHVVTIHDLLPWKFPGLTPSQHDARMFDRMVRRAAKVPTILADTHHVAAQIHAELDVDEERIHVVPLGVDESFQPNIEGWERARNERGDRRLLLILANATDHKRVDWLLEGIARLPSNYDVVHIGALWHHGDVESRVRAAAEPLGDRYQRLEHVDQARLREFLQNADALVHPNVDDGFGLPVLEARASGCPVATTDIPPYRETGTAFTAFFTPGDPDACARAIEEATRYGATGEGRLAIAAELRSVFSWEKTARETSKVYEIAAQ